jgi:hypothetical protein
MQNLAASKANQPAGGEIRIPFSCPKCQDCVTVEWKNLHRHMRCRKCNCQFQIDKSAVRDVSNQPTQRIQFACPRCKHSGSVLRAVALRGIQCIACDLPLKLGPDNRLHSAEELAQMELVAIPSAKPGRVEAFFSWLATGPPSRLKDSPLKWPAAAILLVGFLLIAVYAGNLLMRAARVRSPESLARKFTYVCLDNDKFAPLAYVGEDPVQQVEFRRWKTYYFASLSNHVRPQGDAVEVAIEVLEETPERRIFSVCLKSPHLGERTHQQHWCLQDENWLFDAVATLKGQFGT